MTWNDRLTDRRAEVERAGGEEGALTDDQEQATLRVAVAMVDRERKARVSAERRAAHLAALAVKERDARVAAEARAGAAEIQARAAAREVRAARTELVTKQGPSRPPKRPRRRRFRLLPRRRRY